MVDGDAQEPAFVIAWRDDVANGGDAANAFVVALGDGVPELGLQIFTHGLVRARREYATPEHLARKHGE